MGVQAQGQQAFQDASVEQARQAQREAVQREYNRILSAAKISLHRNVVDLDNITDSKLFIKDIEARLHLIFHFCAEQIELKQFQDTYYTFIGEIYSKSNSWLSNKPKYSPEEMEQCVNDLNKMIELGRFDPPREGPLNAKKVKEQMANLRAPEQARLMMQVLQLEAISRIAIHDLDKARELLNSTKPPVHQPVSEP